MKHRPLAVTILAVLTAITGIVAVVDALRFFKILPVAGLGQLEFFGFAPLAGILSLVVAAIWFSTTRQLLQLDPRGWTFVVVVAIIMLIFEGVALLGGNSAGSLWWSLLLPALVLVLAWLPGTRAAFGQR